MGVKVMQPERLGGRSYSHIFAELSAKLVTA